MYILSCCENTYVTEYVGVVELSEGLKTDPLNVFLSLIRRRNVSWFKMSHQK